MKLGYIIGAHALPHQLIRLVRRLDTGDARFFLHVDARAPDDVMTTVERELGDSPHVELLPRLPVHWAAFSQLAATLAGVRALLDADEDIRYGVLLTGQDYPLRPAEEIERTLEAAEGHSFLNYRPATGRFLKRVTRAHWHRTIRGRPIRIPNRFVPLSVRRPLPGGLAPYTGSAHWCLSRECLEYVAGVEPATVDAFRWASSPDESFFQTILVNSPLAPTIVNDDLRYVDWSEGKASPRVLTSYDLDRLLASHSLFARKFDPSVDEGVLDALDARVSQPAVGAVR